MSESLDSLTALTFAKSSLRRWKSISFCLFLSLLFLAMQDFSDKDAVNQISNTDQIVNVKILDSIMEDDYRSQILTQIANSNNVKAVIIDINSPGGGVVGSEILFNELRNIAKSKPLVVVMGSIAASGGYMAAIASDHIIAHNGTLTGSIGVLMQSAEITNLAQKVGVTLHTYKSSPLKASPSPFEKSNSQVDAAINSAILDSANFFFDLVKSRRGDKLNAKMLSNIFDGRVFTGRQALSAGLIDEIGGREQAINYLKSQKIDTDSLEISEISIVKQEDHIMDKIIGLIPFSIKSSAAGLKSGIMAQISL